VSIQSVRLYFYADETNYKAPISYTLQYWAGSAWADVPNFQRTPDTPLGNGENTVNFAPLQTSKLRVMFHNQKEAATALVEIQIF
jgi:hypothetical protein